MSWRISWKKDKQEEGEPWRGMGGWFECGNGSGV